jgi:predicted RNA binding protein YcfA (HicA-like mRNA interferase family)
MVIRSDPPRLVITPQRKDIPGGTLRAIIGQAGLTIDEFLDLLG